MNGPRRRQVEFGANIDPDAGRYALAMRIAGLVDALEFDLVGIQDHPYQQRFLDTWTLLSALAARTEHVPFLPNVASLPLWIGAYRPRMLRLVGRLADGWLPSLPYAPPDEILRRSAASMRQPSPRAAARTTSAASTTSWGGSLRGPSGRHSTGRRRTLSRSSPRLVLELGMDTFLFWPLEDPERQFEVFAREVVPGVRQRVGTGA